MRKVKFRLLIFLVVVHSRVVRSSDFQITSTPDKALVYIRETSKNKRTKLGETPLKIKIEDIFSNYTADRTFIIEIEKDGHKDYNLLMALVNSADVNLDVKLKISQEVELTKKFDYISAQLFEAQRLMRDKSYSNAIEVLNALAKDHGNLSVVFEMLGSAYYLQKDFQNSLSNYRKAFGLNSENTDAYNMKLYLEKALGIADRGVASVK